MFRLLPALAAFAALVFGQTEDPAYKVLEKAYGALRANDYEAAASAFREAVIIAPDRASIRKDLGYTLLKIGQNEAARDQFGEAMRIDPADTHIALEYAFLCYETKQPIMARRIFERLRLSDATAAEAFENIDRPLREGIARWKEAIELSPNNFSAREELAKLAEQRDELDLAAEQYEAAWRLRIERRDLLIDLARIWKQLDRLEDSNAALLAASRGGEPRIAEQARELLPARYPYVYEFERALMVDPTNNELRREFVYLQLQMNQKPAAEEQLKLLIERAPRDLPAIAQLGLLKLEDGNQVGAMELLNRVLTGPDRELADRVRGAIEARQSFPERSDTDADNPKAMAQKSLEKGYLRDAIKYLNIVHENDPLDYDAILKLGQTYNNLKEDQEAVKWFALARNSPDPKIASEASRAYRNLESEAEPVRTTVWAFPVFSTRWHDLFVYSQVKTELNLQHSWLRPYMSLRFVGDPHSAVVPAVGWHPQYLSENSAILSFGVATRPWRGLTSWFEAGESFHLRPAPLDVSTATPDYRGGFSFARSSNARRLLAESNDDLVYVSRFDHDTLGYSQNRIGLRTAQIQLYWNFNITADLKREYWANFFETGPGMRFRIRSLPALQFSIDALRGTYLVNEGNPRSPDFRDLRLAVWYAFTR